MRPIGETVLAPDGPADPTIRYAVVWKPQPAALAGLPNLEAIFSIGAGVDHIFEQPDIPDVPIVRVVSDDLTARMSEYVVWQVLDHHRMGALYRRQQAQHVWHEDRRQPAAADVTVGIMGIGVLGTRRGAQALDARLQGDGLVAKGETDRGRRLPSRARRAWRPSSPGPTSSSCSCR